MSNQMFLLCGILLALSPAQGQTRRPPLVPQSLLQTLDAEDRQCVTNEGGIAKHVRAASIRLAAKGRQIVIRGSDSCLCGAQNCPFWIYCTRGKHYELLLKGIGSTRVNVGSSSSKGYRDIVAESHASAIQTLIRTYRFDGREYQLAKCLSREYYDENGNSIKIPRLRPCE